MIMISTNNNIYIIKKIVKYGIIFLEILSRMGCIIWL